MFYETVFLLMFMRVQRMRTGTKWQDGCVVRLNLRIEVQ